MESKKTAKLTIIGRLVDFVASFVPLPSAVLATLGGEGLEAGVWQNKGLPEGRGWLIERQKKLGHRLIASQPYHFVQNLLGFPNLFRSVMPGSGIDGFHLDLCGTLEANVGYFRPILPLILKSGGRTLAITVADQRRNFSLDNYQEIRDGWIQVLGRDVLDQMFTRLQGEQTRLKRMQSGASFVPRKAAVREIGLVLYLFRLLSDTGVLPDRVERYIYVSAHKRSPFRMRTYFFHFEEKPCSLRGAKFATELLTRWFRSNPQLLHNGQFLALRKGSARGVSQTMTKNMKQVNTNEAPVVTESKLAQAAKLLGGDALTEYTRLAGLKSLDLNVMNMLATLKSTLVGIVDELNQTLNGYKAGGGPISTTQEVPSAEVPAKRRRRRHRRGGYKVENGELVALQIRLLEARAKGDDSRELAAAKKDAARTLGIIRRSNWGNIVGGLVARTQGKFRKGFVKRALATKPAEQRDALLVRMAGWYSAIEEKDVRPEDLL